MSVTAKYLLGKLPAFKGQELLVKRHQDTTDIIKEMMKAHKLHAADYDKISNFFWKGNLKDTCQFIFNFLKRNVKYSIEPDSRQSVKSPAGILATGYYNHGYNDCKHYSQFFSGVLDSLKRKGKNIDWFYRFANYRIYTTSPQHVFVVATDGKNEYWCDPVLKTFDDQKPYINKIDKKMSLYTISGTDQLNSLAGSIGRRKKSGQPKKKRGLKLFRKIKNVFAKVNMAPSRLAFMALIKLNPFRMTNNLALSLDNPKKRNKLLKMWKNFGGNVKTFEKVVRAQYKHWQKRKHKKVSGIGLIHPFRYRDMKAAKLIKMMRRHKHMNLLRRRKGLLPIPFRPPIGFKIAGADEGIGAVQLVALLAVAAPLITALAQFMPKKAVDDSKAAADTVPADTQAATASNLQSSGSAEARSGGGGGVADESQDKGEADTGSDEDSTLTKTVKGNKNLIIVAAAAGIGLFMLNKKK